jgi:hypothetical protein
MRNRPWRILVVLVFAGLLLIQGVFSFAIEPEPYPAIRMPAFGITADNHGNFDMRISRAEVVNEDGSIQPVQTMELMDEFSYDMARPSYDYLFLTSPPSSITPTVKAWLRRRIQDVHGSSRPAELRMCWQEIAISVYDASVAHETPCIWKVIEL